MNETYVECMVKKHTKAGMKFLKYFLICLSVLIVIASLIVGLPIGLILGIVFGVAAYFVSTYSEVEFEYLYVDRQISVDKIFSQSKRKTVAKYDVEKIEILAPIKSDKLSDYKNRQVKELDYSSGLEDKPDKRYVFYYDGKEKIVFEPNEAFVKAIANVAPRKVSTY